MLNTYNKSHQLEQFRKLEEHWMNPPYSRINKWHLPKGFCQVEKNPRKTRKWVGGSSPNSDFAFFGNCLFFRVFCIVLMFPSVSKKMKTLIMGWVGVVWPIRVFLGFLDFFQLDKTPKQLLSINTSPRRQTSSCEADHHVIRSQASTFAVH